MKAAPIILCFIAIYSVSLTKAVPAPDPNPSFGFIGDMIDGAIGLAEDVIGIGFDLFFGAINGILGGALGGIVGGILGTGQFGTINVDPAKGGCQAENIAQIINNLFESLQIRVVECRYDSDCRGIGVGACRQVTGIPNADKVCQYTRA